MPFSKKVIYFFLCGLAYTSFAQLSMAEIYQWTDAQGQVHFSDRAPSATGAKKITQDLDKINITNDYSSPELMLKQAEAKDRAKEEALREQEERRSKLPSKEDVCKQMRKDHRTLSGRVVFLDKDGKDLGITETERKQRAEALLALIKKRCD